MVLFVAPARKRRGWHLSDRRVPNPPLQRVSAGISNTNICRELEILARKPVEKCETRA